MALESNAAPDEKSSPFYEKNETLCKEWEKFVLDRGGLINGRYNAWSYRVKTKVKGNNTWLIDIEKAQFSSGFLWMSSKKQNLREALTFKALFKNTNCKPFKIEKGRFRGRKESNAFQEKVMQLVQPGIDNGSLFKVEFKDNFLTLVFHHKNDWTEMAERALAFEI
ncbi:MAG: hypothetical protein P8P74_08000 [Crocinitomicaceae bacterium]|nr:hypothetical protein [Crocinitomicaceae bacterium]